MKLKEKDEHRKDGQDGRSVFVFEDTVCESCFTSADLSAEARGVCRSVCFTCSML